MLWATAMMAHFLPRRAASLLNCADKYVFFMRAAAQADWHAMRRNQGLPLRVFQSSCGSRPCNIARGRLCGNGGAMAFIRSIGRWAMVGLVINSIIGYGIFGLPSIIAGLLGT